MLKDDTVCLCCTWCLKKIIVIWDLHRKNLMLNYAVLNILLLTIVFEIHIFHLCMQLFLYQILTWHCNVYKMFLQQQSKKRKIRKHFEERALFSKNASYFFGLYDRNLNYFYVCFKHEKDWLAFAFNFSYILI